jgi:SAM-dependent methyltransferase
MVCHGELARSKPHARYLTSFYLLAAAGGALGGFVVAVLCPLVFSSYLEMNCAVLIGAAFSLVILLRDAQRTWLGDTRQRRLIAGLVYFAVFVFVGLVQFDPAGNPSWASVRNFYGVLHVRGGPESSRVALVHGRIFHGLQFRDPEKAAFPTAYYGPESGVGLALTRRHADQPLRVGAVGLGCGTVAAYGRPGDCYRFYEINPAVVEIARRHFTYLADSSARIEVVLGDARVSLEREPPQGLDVLVLDAFNGDAVPTHLLTREACAVYLRHLRPNGVLAVHISNRHLRLDAVVRGLAEHFQLPYVSILNAGNYERGVLPSEWMLLTRDAAFLSEPRVHSSARRTAARADKPARLWTDQHSNLFEILNVL